MTAINAGTVGEDDAVVTIDLLAGQSDEETTALSAVSISVKDNLGQAVTFIDKGDGKISIDPAQFDALRNGESRTVTVSYGVSDGTVSTANTATLTVHGFTDQTAPVAHDDTVVPFARTSEFLVNTPTGRFGQSEPSIANLSNGGFVITWQNLEGSGDTLNHDIKAQIFDAHGTASGAEFLVNTRTNSAQMNHRSPAFRTAILSSYGKATIASKTFPIRASRLRYTRQMVPQQARNSSSTAVWKTRNISRRWQLFPMAGSSRPGRQTTEASTLR